MTTPLSPSAQAVLDAALDAADSVFVQAGTTRQGIAAALRAAADQPYEVPPEYRGDEYWIFRAGLEAERDRNRAIATELDPTP